MKKIVKISMMLLSMICIVTSVYAASCSMSLQTNKDTFMGNEDVVVDVRITNMNAGEGIIGLAATLEYDKNSLTYVGMEGQNGWANPSYNPANGKLVMDRNALVAVPEAVLKITFKANEQNAQNATITLKDITVSGGIATGDIPVSNITKTVTVGTVTPKPPVNNTVTNTNTNTNINGNTNTNVNTNNNSSVNPSTPGTTNPSGNSQIVANTSNTKTEKDSVKTGILPKTGTTNIVLTIVGAVLILVVIFYVKMKKIDTDMKQ